MIKAIIKSLVLFALCAGFLFLMQKLELLRVSDILSAFNKRPSILVFLALVQVFAVFVMMIRYALLLKVLGIKAPLKQVSSATFVSTAVGQWAPGSLAVVEVLRVGLMIGSQSTQSDSSKSASETVGIKARLAIASFADRLIGFLGILFVGFVFSLVLFVKTAQSGPSAVGLNGVGFLLLSSGLGTCALISMPFLVRSKLLRRLEHRLRIHGPRSQSFLARSWNTFLRHFETFRHNIDAGSRHPLRLVGPLLLSMLSLLLSSLSLYLAAQAIGESLDFFQIVSAFPLIALSGLLPLGFAGIGGYQLIMATIFGLFAVSPSVVASSGVLQSAVALVVNTVIGLLFARVCSQQIKSILNRTPVPQSL